MPIPQEIQDILDQLSPGSTSRLPASGPGVNAAKPPRNSPTSGKFSPNGGRSEADDYDIEGYRGAKDFQDLTKGPNDFNSLMSGAKPDSAQPNTYDPAQALDSKPFEPQGPRPGAVKSWYDTLKGPSAEPDLPFAAPAEAAGMGALSRLLPLLGLLVPTNDASANARDIDENPRPHNLPSNVKTPRLRQL